MAKKGVSYEAKVGLFVLAGLAILFYMTFRLGGVKLSGSRFYPVFAKFSNAYGISEGSDVLMAGVRVGKVDSVDLSGGRAVVKMLIRKSVALDRNTEAVIKAHGVMGERYVELVPPERPSGVLKPGGTIERTRGAEDFGEVLASVGEVSRSIKMLADSLSGALGGEGGKELREAIVGLKEVTESLNSVLKENRGKFARLLDDLDAMAKSGNAAFLKVGNLADSLESGKGTLGKLINDNALYAEMKRAFSNLSAITGDLKSGRGTLGKLLVDDSLYLDTKSVMSNLKDITGKIRRGEGTLGKLVNSDKLYKDADASLKKVGRAGESLEEQTPITTLGAILGIIF